MNRLLFWALAFLAYRLAVLWLFVDAAWTPEEALRGAAALELGNLPLWCLQADSYLGGSLVTAALARGFFLVLGPSLLALKLTALLFALGALLVLYRWLERSDRAAADRFALLYTFAPPSVTHLGALAMGYHTESVLFLALYLAGAARLARAPSARTTLWLGAAGGFGFWYSNLNGIAFAACVLALPWRSWLSPRRGAGLGLGFLLGAVPWLAQNLATAGSGARFLAGTFGHPDPFKALRLLTEALPLGTGYPAPVAYAWLALVLGFLAWGHRSCPAPWKRSGAFYVALLLAFHAATRFTIDPWRGDPVQFRYLQQLQVFLLLGLACVLRGRARVVAPMLAVFAITVTMLGPRTAPPGAVTRYEGASYADLSAHLMQGCFAGREKLPGLLAWIREAPAGPARAMRSLPFVGAYRFGDGPEPPLRAYTFGHARQLAQEGAPRHAVLAAAHASAAPDWFWRGYAAGYGNLAGFPDVSADWFTFERELRDDAIACFQGRPLAVPSNTWGIRGLGAAVADCGVTPEGIAKKAELVAGAASPERQFEFAWGLGWRLRLRHPDPARARDRVERLPEWARAGALSGLEDWNREHSRE